MLYRALTSMDSTMGSDMVSTNGTMGRSFMNV